MSKLLFSVLALIAGMALAIQSQINGGLGKKVGVIEGSFISFSIGTLALLFILIYFGQGEISAVATVPKWQLLGGLLGAFYIIVQVLSVPRIGVSSTIIAVIVGQILVGAIIDHFGLLGGDRIPIDVKKFIAIVLMFFSLFLYHKQ